jgi:uncharacterized protein (TIRG00374 family)
MTISSLRNRFLLSLALGALVFLGVVIYADFNSLAVALATFDWVLLPLILVLTLLNYGLRFVKWEFYLRVIGVRTLSRRNSFLLFFGGLSMAMTPGKVGEWLKSYLLHEVTGTPFTRSAPIIVAERLSDGIAMLLLALVGVVAFNLALELVVIGAVAIGAVMTVILVRPLAMAFLRLGGRLPILSKRIHHFEDLYESSYELFRPTVMIPAVVLGVISWSFECVAMYFVFVGLGLPPSFDLLVQSTFILAAATLAGSIFLLPGGLGAAEVTIVGLTQQLLGADRGVASAAALIIRLCTLWFGVLVGVISLLVFLRVQPTVRREAMLEDVESSGDTPAAAR